MSQTIEKIKRFLIYPFRKLTQPFAWFFRLSFWKKIRVVVISFFSVLTLFTLLLFGFYQAVLSGIFGELPSEESLQEIKNHEASEVYSADSVLLGRYYLENRSDTKFWEISPYIIDALIATEDARFYDHKGVDQRSMLRVLFKTILLGQHAGGGSTISQQLVKNLMGRKKHGILTVPVTKIKEAILANRLEGIYTKQEVLTLYLNTVSFGEDTYGIQTACERFFSTTATDIKQEEAAMLIGMLKATGRYNPRKHPERALNRRNTVIRQLYRYDYITEGQKDSLQALGLELNYQRIEKNEGIATYFREYLRQYLDSWLKQHPKSDGTTYNLYTDGLTIYTTINSKMQHYAEQSVSQHLSILDKKFKADLKESQQLTRKMVRKELRKTMRYQILITEGMQENDIYKKLKEPIETSIFVYGKGMVDTLISPIDSVVHSLSTLQSGFLVMNPIDGTIKAWVGGSSFKHVEYDHVLAARQVGSVFKPIIYAQALKNGYSPCDFIHNREEKYTQYEDWVPQNSDKNYEGKYSLIGALTNSVNTISVRLCMESGIDSVIKTAKQLGIEEELPRVPSIALGVGNVSLKNMLGAYSAFANKGFYSEYQFVKSIENRDGENLYRTHLEQENVYTVREAENVTSMLQSVVNQGTASRLRSLYNINGPIAGKTGTTQNHTDGWFIGYTPEWSGGVWVGADNPSLHFRSIKDGQGANMALPIWALFYQKVYADDQLTSMFDRREFPPLIDCKLYKKDNAIVKFFKKKAKKNKNTGLEQSRKKKKWLK